MLVRIDDRLVHGQIIEGWVKHLEATRVTVVSDSLVNNWARRTVMEFSLPREVELQVLTTAQIAERGDLEQPGVSGCEIVLFAGPDDVLKAIDQGLRLTALNLGGMHHFNGGVKLTVNISLTQEDVNDLKQLLVLGIAIKVCALPKDKGIDLRELL